MTNNKFKNFNTFQKIVFIIVIPIFIIVGLIYLITNAIIRIRIVKNNSGRKILSFKQNLKVMKLSDYFENNFISDLLGLGNKKVYCYSERYSNRGFKKMNEIFNQHYYTPAHVEFHKNDIENYDVYLNEAYFDNHKHLLLGHELGHAFLIKRNLDDIFENNERKFHIEAICDFYGVLLDAIQNNKDFTTSISEAQALNMTFANKISLFDFLKLDSHTDENKYRFMYLDAMRNKFSKTFEKVEDMLAFLENGDINEVRKALFIDLY